MPLEERRERHAALLRANLEHNVNKWQTEFLDALRVDDPTGEEIRATILDGTLRRPSPGTPRVPRLASRGLDPVADAPAARIAN